jgi:hypothetical protein
MTNLRWRVPGIGGDAEKFAALAQKKVIGHAGEAIALFLSANSPTNTAAWVPN